MSECSREARATLSSLGPEQDASGGMRGCLAIAAALRLRRRGHRRLEGVASARRTEATTRRARRLRRRSAAATLSRRRSSGARERPARRRAARADGDRRRDADAAPDGGPHVATIHYLGRFDTRDPAGPRFAWPGSAIAVDVSRDRPPGDPHRLGHELLRGRHRRRRADRRDERRRQDVHARARS